MVKTSESKKRLKKKPKRLSKRELVKRHLMKHKSISSFQAFKLFGTMRLSDIIFNLKKKNDWIIEGKNLVPANISGFEFPNYKYTLIGRYVQPKIQPVITISGTTTRKEIELIGKHFKF